MKKPKVSVIGAGNVGGTLAQRIAESDLADAVLLDIALGTAQGKSLDLADARSVLSYESRVTATSDYNDISGSVIVVITAGLARKPGMTREDLLKKNGSIVKDIVLKVRENAPEAIVIMVTNPLDVLTNMAFKAGKFDKRKILGMGGILDSSRCANIIAEKLNVPVRSVEAMVIGAHGKNMLPLIDHCRVEGKPLKELLAEDQLAEVITETIGRGAKIVSCLGQGSAFYAPSAAAFSMVKAILLDEQRTVPACACCGGEYGISGACIGVPARLGRNGVEEIIEIELQPEDRQKLIDAAAAAGNAAENLGL